MSEREITGPAPVRVIIRAALEWWDNAFQMAVINVLWVACWFTIVLGPPATFGMYYAAYKVAREEFLAIGDWWVGLRRYFVKSWVWMSLNLFVAFIVWLNLSFYVQFGEAWWAALLQGIFLAFGAGWWMVQFFALPYVMESPDASLRAALRNGAYTIFASPGYSLTLIAAVVVLLGVSAALVGPFLFGIVSLIALMGAFAVRERLAFDRGSANREGAEQVEK